ncbi:MAG: hypothetical protein N4A37_12180 [Prolixibacteraceae bacterium]|jgi:uncharacterized protein (TIGR02145 family)|nr:hypothetical protein [Prolixibacteraceae bacterium]
MKTLFIPILVLTLLLFGCSKKEMDNHPPEVPILITPPNEAIISIDSQEFTWKTNDKDGDVVNSTLMISKDGGKNWTRKELFGSKSILIFNNTNDNIESYVFEKGVKYLWKVIAQDVIPEQSLSSESETYCFYTQPKGLLNLEEQSGHEYIDLKWKDAPNLKHIELSINPTIENMPNSIIIKPGVEKYSFKGVKNRTVYTFSFTVIDNDDHKAETQIIKSMPLPPDMVHDADFNMYTTVKIGDQTWMRENLRTTKWQDGTPLTLSNGQEYPVKCLKNPLSDEGGYFYPKSIINADKSICPKGYHIPSDEEWKQLERYLGMPEEDLDKSNYDERGQLEGIGRVLKSQNGWKDYEGNSGNGIDSRGLNIKPEGILEISGYMGEYGIVVKGQGILTYLWTSTQSKDKWYNITRFFRYDKRGIFRFIHNESLSVRCIKDSK